MITINPRLTAILLGIGVLLLIPLIAMQFTSEVDWSLADFIIAAFLLLSTGLVIELVLRKAIPIKQKLIYCAIILLTLFLIWAELAVGIFGSPFAGS